MNTIYNTFVKLKSQKQANKLKNACIEKRLNYYWNDDETFKYIDGRWDNFVFDDKDCFLVSNEDFDKTEISENEFLELLNNVKSDF
jgi:hypothetical protein